MSLTIESNIYYRSHGRDPRGRGGWAFIVSPTLRRLLDTGEAGLPLSFFENGSELVVFVTGASRTFGEAKKLFSSIVRHVAPKGVRFFVEVAP